MNDETVEQTAPAIAAEVEDAPAVQNERTDSHVGKFAEHDAQLNDLDRRIRDLEAAIGDLRTVSPGTAHETAAASREAVLPSREAGHAARATVSASRELPAGSREALPATGRRTQGSFAPRMLAKGAEPVQAGGVDAALTSLSVEQRLAVKAGLLRAGLL